jgi:glycosyltransferase involved in cell wall biosynthesis
MRMAVIPNALSTSAVRHLDAEPAAATRCDRIIAVGSYDWQKGHDFVLRAYARSGARNRIPLRIFGQSFTPFADRLRRLANALNIQSEYLSFGEGVSGDALFEEVASARILVSGSHTECQPLVLLDSMAAGTPFVARSTGCIPALPGGLAVTSVAEAASAINELLSKENYWLGISSAGRDAARRVFHPDVVGRALVGELRQVLEVAT